MKVYRSQKCFSVTDLISLIQGYFKDGDNLYEIYVNKKLFIQVKSYLSKDTSFDENTMDIIIEGIFIFELDSYKDSCLLVFNKNE